MNLVDLLSAAFRAYEDRQTKKQLQTTPWERELAIAQQCGGAELRVELGKGVTSVNLFGADAKGAVLTEAEALSANLFKKGSHENQIFERDRKKI